MKPPTPGLEPTDWAIRTCPEADVVANLHCWLSPTVAAADGLSLITEALRVWRELGLAHIEQDEGARRYDLSEVINFMVVAGLRGRDRFWLEHIAPSQVEQWLWFEGRDFSWTDPPAPEQLPARACKVAYERRYDPKPEHLGQRLRLKLPTPLASAHWRTDQAIYSGPPQSNARVHADRFDCTVTPTNLEPLTLSFFVEAVARPVLPDEAELSDADRLLFTKEREGLIVISPLITELSNALSIKKIDHAAITRLFFEYICDHCMQGQVPYHALDPHFPTDWPLTRGVFDCQIGSALLIALCRSRGIPARLVNGYQIYNTYQANHYWAEIWLDGRWHPFDLSGWEAFRITGSTAWRDCFAGQLEYRMPLQSFPRQTTGPSSIGLGAFWSHAVSRAHPGTSTHYRSAHDCASIYTDTVSVEWACAPDFANARA